MIARVDHAVSASRKRTTIARRSGSSASKRASSKTTVANERMERALQTEIEFIAHPDFNRTNAATLILKSAASQNGSAECGGDLRSIPLLTKEEEQSLFRAMNFSKYQAALIQRKLPRSKNKIPQIEEMERLLRQGNEVRNHILRANLRLVISIAKKYVNAANSFDELISEGNLSLLQAVDKFDISRGNRFSTYATRAIRNNLYHYVFDKHKKRQQVGLAEEELLLTASDDRANEKQCELRLDYIRRSLARIMQRLDAQKQSIIASRFGLNGDDNPQTLKEIAKDLGVSRERVRQIQVRAMQELRQYADEARIELPDE